MNKFKLAALLFGVAGSVSVPAVYARTPQERQQERRADEGKARPEYHFRHEDAPKLRQHYDRIERVDVNHRGEYRVGGTLPRDWHKRMRPVPVAVVRELPPPPPGYVFGYIDGYAVVYDPNTGYILETLDLANLPH